MTAERPLNGSEVDDIVEDARGFSHRPPGVTLADEFASALDAISHGVDAVGKLHEIVLDVARELYPREWSSLVPRLVSLASWVGYDHDGRSDIGWADTLRIRLKSKQAQLALQIKRCAVAVVAYPESRAAPTLELIESLLALASKQVELQIEASESADRNHIDRSRLFARQLVHGRDHALTDINRIVKLIARAIDDADDPKLAIDLAAMRAALGRRRARSHAHAFPPQRDAASQRDPPSDRARNLAQRSAPPALLSQPHQRAAWSSPNPSR